MVFRLRHVPRNVKVNKGLLISVKVSFLETYFVTVVILSLTSLVWKSEVRHKPCLTHKLFAVDINNDK